MAEKLKRPKGKYKFSAKETKPVSVMGAVLGALSLITLLLLILLTFLRGGEATISYAFAGLLASLFSVAGLILSILCVHDAYQYHLPGWIGMITSGVSLAALAGILYLGMM